MSALGSPRATLKRGALVAAANWPVVLIQFVTDATFKLMVAVPSVGGAVLVALTLGRDLTDLLGGDARDIVTAVGEALVERPVAFACFLGALALALAAGSALVLLAKGGTVAVLAAGERCAGEIEHGPVRASTLAHASAFSTEAFLAGCRRLFRPYVRLAVVLAGVYVASAAIYLAVLWGIHRWIPGDRTGLAWAIAATAWSALLVGWIMLVNLVYVLTQVAMAVEHCGLRLATRHVSSFLRQRGAEVGLVFLWIFGLVVVATAASVLATAGLGLISFVPLVGLAVFPLQTIAWLVRGIVFQYLGLTAVGAYLSLYRTVPAASPRCTVAGLRTAS